MAVVEHGQSAPGEKGLKGDALGMLSSIVIGVASTAPGYSLAASLGLVVAAVGLASPAIMWIAFVPMLLVATSYYYLNRVDPDCGTTFSWATKAFGPVSGWIGGWAIIVADVIVMANLADIAGRYSYLLVGADGAANSKYAVMLIGVIWIIVMTWICYVGIEVSAKLQWFLLAAEVITLVIFAVVALYKVYFDAPAGSARPSLSWLSPGKIPDFTLNPIHLFTLNPHSTSALAAGVLVAVFIYWGWDSLVAVNEETEDKERTPGIAAIISTVILVLIYVVVTFAAQAFAGTKFLVDNSDDVLSSLGKAVLGSPFDKLLIIAVLSSASASTQTTILPTTRTSLSMAAHGALPRTFARIHPRFLTPSTSTIWMGVLSVVWYAGLTAVSQNILFDSIAALGLMIAFYYGLTGFACAWFFRHNLKTAKGILLAGVAPVVGGIMLLWVFIRSCIDLAQPANSESGNSWFGVGPPLAIAVLFLLLGVVVMLLQWRVSPAFFRRRAEVAPPEMTL
jgi:amino acid transporter